MYLKKKRSKEPHLKNGYTNFAQRNFEKKKHLNAQPSHPRSFKLKISASWTPIVNYFERCYKTVRKWF